MMNHIYAVGDLVILQDRLVRVTDRFDVDRSWSSHTSYYDYQGVWLGIGGDVVFDEYEASLVDDYSIGPETTAEMLPQIILWNNQIDKKLELILNHLGIDSEP